MKYKCYYSDELYHYGVKGMKWGVRRYQNEDGSWTKKGLKRKTRLEKEEKARRAKMPKKEYTVTFKMKNDS